MGDHAALVRALRRAGRCGEVAAQALLARTQQPDDPLEGVDRDQRSVLAARARAQAELAPSVRELSRAGRLTAGTLRATLLATSSESWLVSKAASLKSA